ncbi:MAG: hypothetical protein IJT88_01150 [Kiritimatiellae bacterium]|nr:hypothetical protein [Kiritimatiellia bacterium]
MWHVADNLDYQTVFQILAAFEGFSVWKGGHFFQSKNRAVIGVDMPETFDNEEFAARCEALKTGEQKGREFIRVGRMLFAAKLKQ